MSTHQPRDDAGRFASLTPTPTRPTRAEAHERYRRALDRATGGHPPGRPAGPQDPADDTDADYDEEGTDDEPGD